MQTHLPVQHALYDSSARGDNHKTTSKEPHTALRVNEEGCPDRWPRLTSASLVMDHPKLVQVQRRSRRHMHVAFAPSNPSHYNERFFIWLEATVKGTLYKDECRDGWHEGEAVYVQRKALYMARCHIERHFMHHHTLCGTVLAAGLIPLNFAARTPLTPRL